jgi:ribosome-associated protein
MRLSPAQKQTRALVQAAAAVCEEKKALDTRILELDSADSGLSDFFLVTSASNERQAVAIADEIEQRLKRDFGVYPNSVEGRRHGEWILLDYVDFVVHVFLLERRAFYDIERLRKSARPLTPEEFDAELKTELKDKTRAARSKSPIKARATSKKPATKSATKSAPRPAAKPTNGTKKPAKPAKSVKKPAKKAAPRRKAVAAKKKTARPSAKKAKRSR